ncbi:MAG: hypothetical protein R3Y44_04445 [Rikenellaceae bacterium]
MRRFFTSILSLIIVAVAVSCSDSNDGIYVSTSGEGSVIVGYDSPLYLYRMILFTSDDEQEIYLMGNSAYVDADAQFKGRGAAVKFTIPNSEDNSTLLAQSFDIDNSDYFVSYIDYINYSAAESEDDFVSLESGTVIIRKSGSFYDIRLLGSNTDSENVLIAYRGYIYRTLLVSDEDMAR